MEKHHLRDHRFSIPCSGRRRGLPEDFPLKANLLQVASFKVTLHSFSFPSKADTTRQHDDKCWYLICRREIVERCMRVISTLKRQYPSAIASGLGTNLRDKGRQQVCWHLKKEKHTPRKQRQGVQMGEEIGWILAQGTADI